MKHVYFGILAGGKGERLWPLSKEGQPKQLLPFLDDKTLLQHTVARIKALTPYSENIFIITNKDQEDLIKKDSGDAIGFILAEPCGRNTGPAILWATQQIHRKDPSAVVVFLSADGFIPEVEKFNNTLEKAINFVTTHEKIATLGVVPTYPATGYGYIQAQDSDHDFSPVKKFHEKPDIQRAKNYCSRNDMFWNMGIFAAQTNVFINEFQMHAPELSQSMNQFLQEKISYDQIPNISIDYAVMEKSSNIIILPGSFGWHDIGNLHTFLKIQAQYDKKFFPSYSLNSKNNMVSSSKKIVACIGVQDLCIIETEDVLLVAHNQNVEEVKKILQELKK